MKNVFNYEHFLSYLVKKYNALYHKENLEEQYQMKTISETTVIRH